jgi:hypothetical protein
MIETRLTASEARWLVDNLGLTPGEPSPLAEVLATIDPVPPASPAAGAAVAALRQRGIVDSSGSPNLFVATALAWLSDPERVWSLSVFGPGGAQLVHLAFRSGAAVECRRGPDDLTLRYPFAADEATSWLERHAGGPHAR